MPHTTPIIPESQPNNRKTSTLNETMKATRANANTNYGAGMAANSTASGNSIGVDSNIEDRSFWASLTRRLRYFSAPSLAYLRIPNKDKPKERTSVYDVVEYFTGPPDGLYLGAKATKDTGSPYYRNPWESYDGFTYTCMEGKHNPHPLQIAAGDGCWDVDHQFLTYNSPGYDKNHEYFQPKENRYVEYGGAKVANYWIDPLLEPLEADLVERYSGWAPQYFWSYGWAEVIDDFDINRSFSPIFNFIPKKFNLNNPESLRREPRPKEKNPGIKYDPITGEPEPEPPNPDGPGGKIEVRHGSCREAGVPRQFMSHGGLYGSAMGCPAYEVNNCMTFVGQVVRMYKGKGDYYLFNNTNCPEEGGQGWPPNYDSAPYHFWYDTYKAFQYASATWY